MSYEQSEKAKFVVAIFKRYAKENGHIPRATSDISPLEDWLIRMIYNQKVSIETTLAKHPYSVKGLPNTYNDYNQGWQDACEVLLSQFEE